MKIRLSVLASLIAMSVFLSGCGDSHGLPARNVAPVANAGSTQSVVVGTSITLDASGSTDVNADSLTYRWTITSQPSGSHAALSNAAAVKPILVVDVAGNYVVSLVVNDGHLDSAAAAVTLIASAAPDVPPVAQAGTAQNVTVGVSVMLNGSASSDADGDDLTYAWTLTAPGGSAAALSDRSAAKPSFTADVAGSYVASLVVSDGRLSSAASTVTTLAAAKNVAPVANGGSAQSVARGNSVTLDGSGSSDANGDMLSYTWSLTSMPSGSTATLSSISAVAPTFTPDVAGVYVAQLIAFDGQVASDPTTVTITAAPIVTTTELVVNGSFEQDLTGWTQGEGPLRNGGLGSCGMNVATAPGVESVTGTPGFPTTSGTRILLSSVFSTNPSPLLGYECYVYQDVTIPAALSTLTLTYDATTTGDNGGCSLAAVLVYLGPNRAQRVSTFCAVSSDSSLTTTTVKLDPTSNAGTTVRIWFSNVATFQSNQVVGIDNIHLIAVSSK
jgi:hypothetical protein